MMKWCMSSEACRGQRERAQGVHRGQVLWLSVQDMWGSSLTRGKDAYLEWGKQCGQILRNVLEEQLFV